jgi:hypothetical protein
MDGVTGHKLLQLRDSLVILQNVLEGLEVRADCRADLDPAFLLIA